MKLKNILAVMAISAITAVMSVWGYGKVLRSQSAGIQDADKIPANYAGFFGNNAPAAGAVDFTPAATSATPAVVHIKTKTKARQVSNSQGQRYRNPFADLFGGDDMSDFFGGGPRMIPEQRASGSGVIITDDGYIVTNNHVVEGADEINVTLANKRSYKATVIGTDANSDIAVIKIDATKLPYMVYGNSDDAKLGQWVLAIGYPLNLDVTVTAGIVSAKSRSIGINDRQNPNNSAIESFIQTDAAVNPGNSGGALVNTDGQLIGINSAIASPTGSYAGYSYAIPVNIVKKVVTDIVKFGTVQRAYIGIKYPKENISDEQRKELGDGYKEGEGVYVTDVPADGAAAAAGIKKGDIVTKINGVTVSSGPELQEQVTRFKPGDKISLTYVRNGKENTVPLVLKNVSGNTDVVKTTGILEKLGAELVAVDSKVAAANQIQGGVVVKRIGEGLLKKTRMQEGFIITSVNDQEIKTVADLDKILSLNKGRKVKIEGVYPGFESTYPYPLDLSDVE